MPTAGFTYGLELEWADVLRSVDIPKHLGSWNMFEDTIVNSDGTSNDQLGDRDGKGGEINTVPSKTISEQVLIAKSLLDVFEKNGFPPTVNYKCGMHVHVGYAGLPEDLEGMKAIMRYIGKYQKELVWSTFQPKPPKAQEYKSVDDFIFASEYFNKYKIPYCYHIYDQKTIDLALSAKSVENFFDAIRPIEDEYDETDRSYINLTSIEKNGTVEFRQFPSTVDVNQIQDCIDWCSQFVAEALGQQRHPSEFMGDREYAFPEPMYINVELERLYRQDYLLNATGDHAKRLRGRERKWR